MQEVVDHPTSRPVIIATRAAWANCGVVRTTPGYDLLWFGQLRGRAADFVAFNEF